jgi:lauroyl/myristoyl acyltransferase
MIVRPPKRRRSAWRRLRRATRGPRNAALARAIRAFVRLLGAFPVPVALAIGRALGAGAHALLATTRRFAVTHVGLAFPELDARAAGRRATFRHAGRSFAIALFPKVARRPDTSGWKAPPRSTPPSRRGAARSS